MIRKEMVKKMMKVIKKFKLLISTSIVCMLPSVYGLLIWNDLPDKVPTHWNAQGVIDGWSSKGFAVFGLPLMLLAFNLIVYVAMRTDPKEKNQGGKIKALGMWICPVTSIFVCMACFNGGIGTEGEMVTYVCLLVEILFVIMGNYMPKCKQNYTVGIKLPWTLNSEENWNKTHRLGGYLWIVIGLVMIVVTLMGYPVVILPGASIMIIVPSVYSYILYKKGI